MHINPSYQDKLYIYRGSEYLFYFIRKDLQIILSQVYNQTSLLVYFIKKKIKTEVICQSSEHFYMTGNK